MRTLITTVAVVVLLALAHTAAASVPPHCVQYAEKTPDCTLPHTGTDLSWRALGAVFALLGGGGLLAVSRAKRNG